MCRAHSWNELSAPASPMSMTPPASDPKVQWLCNHANHPQRGEHPANETEAP